MKVFTKKNGQGCATPLLKGDFHRLKHCWEKELGEFLLGLNYPGVAIHLQRKVENNFYGTGDVFVILTIVMRQFGKYASLGSEIDTEKNLDSNWSPNLSVSYTIGTLSLARKNKLEDYQKKVIEDEIIRAIRQFVDTGRIYSRLTS